MQLMNAEQKPARQSMVARAGMRLALLSPKQWRAHVQNLPGSDQAQQLGAGYGALLSFLHVQPSPAQLRAKHLGLPTHSRAVNMDVAQLQVELQGARLLRLADPSPATGLQKALDELLTAVLAPHHIAVHAVQAFSYCLVLPDQLPLPVAAEPDQIVGMDLKAELPQPMFWQKLLNDIQIEIAQQPSLAVVGNSVWFWGAHSSAGSTQIDNQLTISVQSEDPILLALRSAGPSISKTVQLCDVRYHVDAGATLAAFKPTIYWCSDGRVLVARGSLWQRLRSWWNQ